MTLAGRCHAHNVGTSLMSAVGGLSAEWVAHSLDEYQQLAVAAAADLAVGPCLQAMSGGSQGQAPCQGRAPSQGPAPDQGQVLGTDSSAGLRGGQRAWGTGWISAEGCWLTTDKFIVSSSRFPPRGTARVCLPA